MCHLVLLATYVIAWWCHLEQTITTHTFQPLNAYHPQNTTHHHGEYELLAWRMPKETHDTWQWVLSSAWQSQKVYISTVFQPWPIRRHVYNPAIQKTMHKQQMHQQCLEEWGLHQSWCKALLHYAWLWKGIVSGREVHISLQMVVNNIFNWLVGGGNYISSKCDSWYAPWGNL